MIPGMKIEDESQRHEYVATAEELAAIDAAIKSVDAGEFTTEREIEAAFAKFRRK
jgi:predicted transcriptional regulator